MKKLFIILTFLVWLPMAHANEAESRKGLEALNAGDYAKALSIWLPLAEDGDNTAQGLLGIMYQMGQGVDVDYKEAEKWYRKSAEQGNRESQFRLAGLLSGVPNSRTGLFDEYTGVPQDLKEATKWYRKSAKQAHGRAQATLASRYLLGEGVVKDYSQAYMWAVLAAVNGLGSKLLFALIKREATPEEIELGYELAQTCLDSKYKNCGE